MNHRCSDPYCDGLTMVRGALCSGDHSSGFKRRSDSLRAIMRYLATSFPEMGRGLQGDEGLVELHQINEDHSREIFRLANGIGTIPKKDCSWPSRHNSRKRS